MLGVIIHFFDPNESDKSIGLLYNDAFILKFELVSLDHGFKLLI